MTKVDGNSFLFRIGSLEKSLKNARSSSLSTCRAFEQLCCRKALPCTIVFISVNRGGKLGQVLEEVLLQFEWVCVGIIRVVVTGRGLLTKRLVGCRPLLEIWPTQE